MTENQADEIIELLHRISNKMDDMSYNLEKMALKSNELEEIRYIIERISNQMK